MHEVVHLIFKTCHSNHFSKISSSAFACCISLGELLTLCEPQFPHL